MMWEKAEGGSAAGFLSRKADGDPVHRWREALGTHVFTCDDRKTDGARGYR